MRLNEIEVEMRDMCDELKKAKGKTAEEVKRKQKLLRATCGLLGEFDDLTHIRVEIPCVPASTKKMNIKLRRTVLAAAAGR